MTLHDVDRIYKGWARVPSQRMVLMAIGSALGVKFQQPSLDKPKYITSVDEVRRLMAITGGRIEGLAKIGGAGHG